MTEADLRIEAGVLRTFLRTVFSRLGSGEDEAAAIADSLVDTSLMGHDSHGVSIIPRYIERALDGRISANAHMTVVKDEGPVLVIDGNRGYGQVIGREAMMAALAKAERQRFALLALRNTHHLGRIGEWAEMCAAAGFVSMHFCNAVSRAPVVAPHGGRLPRLGTAPYTAAFPRTGAPPVLVDMATSTVSMNKVRIALNKGAALAPGTIIDGDGNPTTDPGAMYGSNPGSILAAGGHKGYALAVAVELFAGALTGGGVMLPERAEGDVTMNSLFSVIFDPELFVDRTYYDREVALLYDGLRTTPPAPGSDGVLVPGDPERIAWDERSANGVPVDTGSWKSMCEWARRAGVNDTDIPTID
jgi:uncharacterized oxidoreductase